MTVANAAANLIGIAIKFNFPKHQTLISSIVLWQGNVANDGAPE